MIVGVSMEQISRIPSRNDREESHVGIKCVDQIDKKLADWLYLANKFDSSDRRM